MITESTRQAWARYVSTGIIDGSLLREPVLRAWERAHPGSATEFRASNGRRSRAGCLI
jgi:hypothetical protein